MAFHKFTYDWLFLLFFAGEGFTGNVSESYKEKIWGTSLTSQFFPKTAKNIRVYLHQEETFQCGLKLALLQVPQKVPVTDFDID